MTKIEIKQDLKGKNTNFKGKMKGKTIKAGVYEVTSMLSLDGTEFICYYFLYDTEAERVINFGRDYKKNVNNKDVEMITFNPKAIKRYKKYNMIKVIE